MLLLTAFVNPVSVLSIIKFKPNILFNFEIIASIPALKHLSFFITFLSDVEFTFFPLPLFAYCIVFLHSLNSNTQSSCFVFAERVFFILNNFDFDDLK